MKNKLFTAISAVTASLVAINSHASSVELFEEITILGDKDAANAVAGSATYLSAEELQVFSYSDIQQVLRQVPGVYVQYEDGYGLRPNIGIRGVSTERSARIALLEDGVPIAPAPYAASSAYYFPTTGRMNAVEVLKGPAAISEGPNNIGGALNLISTPIPNSAAGNLVQEVGEDSTTRTHLTYGATNSSGFGYLVETHQMKSDGFQTVNGTNDTTGYDIEDYTLKMSYAPAGSAHSFEMKYQYAQQDSDQSYLGLTDNDFKQNPYQRYGVSQLDHMATEHNQLILRHGYKFSDTMSLSTTVYNNEHKRNWYKLNNSISAIQASAADPLDPVLEGGDSTAGALEVKSNNREYYSRGVALKLDMQRDIHSIEMGLRYHEDEEDRFQYSDYFTQMNGAMVFDNATAPGAKGDRVVGAEATSVYIKDTIDLGDLTVTAGVRFEDIDLDRTDWSDGGPRNVVSGTKANSITVTLPSLGATYKVNGNLSLLAGIYQGFGAPTVTDGVDNEEALNIEVGGRYQDGNTSASLVVFSSDYENLVGECTQSVGCTGNIGDTFNGGEASVLGAELTLATVFAMNASTTMPLSISYTYTDAEFDQTFDSEFFGQVNEGDSLPYIPENQLSLTAGIDMGDLSITTIATFIDSMCTVGTGCTEKTYNQTNFDLVANYEVNDDLSFYTRVDNITDEADIVARQPKGARPNRGRTALVGVRLSF
jgi:Fe(3+) dicitrate transport protein